MEEEIIVKTIQEAEKGDQVVIYGIVFSNLGGAPWIDIDDLESD